MNHSYQTCGKNEDEQERIRRLLKRARAARTCWLGTLHLLPPHHESWLQQAVLAQVRTEIQGEWFLGACRAYQFALLYGPDSSPPNRSNVPPLIAAAELVEYALRAARN